MAIKIISALTGVAIEILQVKWVSASPRTPVQNDSHSYPVQQSRVQQQSSLTSEVLVAVLVGCQSYLWLSL